jgi:hypothetical protein
MQKQERQMKLVKHLNCRTMLTLHRLPSIEKIESVAYGDVGNKQTNKQTNKQAITTKKIGQLNQRNIILLIADCSAAYEGR